MPLVQNASPNTDNYFVGKGVMLFKADGETCYQYLGNVSKLQFKPTLDTLDHFSSMAGVKSKDKTVVLSKGGTLTITMEELTAENLALFFLTTVDNSNPDQPEMEIYAEESKAGAVKFIGTNEVGPRYTFEFLNVDFIPSGTFEPISDSWGSVEVTGNVGVDATGSFGTIVRTDLLGGGAIPTNLGLPAIEGTPVEGETLEAFVGVWEGPPSTYTYIWKADGTPIGGATDSTYVLTSGEHGKLITVEVTATNDSGDTPATSCSIGPVVIIS